MYRVYNKAGGVVMARFEEFMKEHRGLAYKVAEQSAVYDSTGNVLLAKGDTWRDEAVWDQYYEELKASDKHPAPGGMVRPLPV